MSPTIWLDLPNRLILVDGEIKMADGSDLKEYLSAYQQHNRIPNGTPMTLQERSVVAAQLITETYTLAA